MREINTSDKRFHNGNGRNEMGTVVTAEWLNAVQDELVGVIKGLGGQVDPSRPNQIWQLLAAEFGKKADVKHSHTTADIEGLTEALDEAGKKGLPVGAIVAFPRAVVNPVGFLKCDGTTFTQSLYPDLYQVLGNKNKLPDLTRSDVGMTAYFAVDNIPAGWIAFDQIRTQVTESAYPELYQYLVAKYGSIDAVPLAEDRFIRNAHGDLNVGQTQEDEIKTHQIDIPDSPRQGSNLGIFYYGEKGGDATDRNQITYNGGNETRPKTLVLKLCIKAQNSLDDVQFWVKAFGSVDNQGMMDASQIAVALQSKADLEHLHTADQITGFDNAVAAQFSYQKIGDFEVRKYPDGTMIQTGTYLSNNFAGSGNGAENVITLPQAFVDDKYICVNAEQSNSAAYAKYNWAFCYPKSQSEIGIRVWYRDTNIHWLAIGRWK